MDCRIFTSPAIRRRALCTATTATELSPTSLSKAESPTTKTVQPQAGMGLGIGDYNADGKMDIFKTHFAEDTPVLYRNQGKWVFEDVSFLAGFGAATKYVCWGAGMHDFDNDGWNDIAYVTGNVYPEVEKFFKEYPHRSPRKIFRNFGNGKFSDVSQTSGAGISDPHSSRGCAFGDFDNDGDVDWLIMNMNEPPTLLRNDANNKNSWLEVKLIGTKSNRTAIGARVKIEYKSEDNKSQTQTDEVRSSGSYYSHNDLRVHFGLGKATKINSIEVKWLGGGTDKIPNVASNQIIKIKEGSVTRSARN